MEEPKPSFFTGPVFPLIILFLMIVLAVVICIKYPLAPVTVKELPPVVNRTNQVAAPRSIPAIDPEAIYNRGYVHGIQALMLITLERQLVETNWNGRDMLRILLTRRGMTNELREMETNGSGWLK